MAQIWISTPKRRLMLAGLSLLGRVARPWLGGRQPPVVETPAVRRILVVELWNIGDVVLMMPFLAQLRAIFPDAKVTLLAQPHAKVLLEGTGLVDEVLEAQLLWTDALLANKPLAYDWRGLRRVRRQLRQRKFDIAFQCRMHIREQIILAMSGAPRRVGFAFPDGDGVLTDAIPVEDPGRHKTADWLRLLAPFAGPLDPRPPMLSVSKSENEWAREYLAAHGITPLHAVIGVHPGASAAEKRWPLDRFQAITADLATRPGLRILAFTEPGGYGAPLGDIPGVIRVHVALRELIALIDRCDVLVGNDSGPMHIAGALGVPTVAIFAAGIDRLFSPLGVGHEIVLPDPGADQAAGPAGSAALSRVPVTRVLAAVDRVLERNRAARPSPAIPLPLTP